MQLLVDEHESVGINYNIDGDNKGYEPNLFVDKDLISIYMCPMYAQIGTVLRYLL